MICSSGVSRSSFAPPKIGRYQCVNPLKLFHPVHASQPRHIFCRGATDSSGSQETRNLSRVQQKNIVIAVDSSEDSIAAFDYALVNVYKPGDRVTILHVLSTSHDSPAPGSVFYAHNSWDPLVDETLQEQAQEFLQQEFVERASEQGIDVDVILVIEHSRRSTVGRIICKKAEELRAEPLVLGTHQRGYFQELLASSVSRYCAKNCKQPVLLVQPKVHNRS